MHDGRRSIPKQNLLIDGRPDRHLRTFDRACHLQHVSSHISTHIGNRHAWSETCDSCHRDCHEQRCKSCSHG
jgi:hypothetical protein